MFYLDEIKWRVGEEEGYFHPEMVFDLRSLPDCGTPGVTAGKFVLCEGVTAPAGSVALGDLGHALTVGERQSVRSVLGWTPSGTVEDFIYQLMGPEADVTGQARCKPVRVGRGMRLAFKIGSFQYDRRVALVDSDWQRTCDLERIHYAGWRAEARRAAQALVDAGRTWEQVQGHLANQSQDAVDIALSKLGAPDKHLRCLDYLQEKFGRPHTDFLGSLPDEGVLPHRTTLSENFNGADKEGVGYQLTFTEVTGDMDNVSNAVGALVTADSHARAESDLATDDHYSQIQCTARFGTVYIVVSTRFSTDADPNEDFYWARWRINSGITAPKIVKRVNGTDTTVATGTAESFDVVATLKFQSNDSTHTVFMNGAEKFSGTDSAITGNLRCGFGLENGGNAADRMDNFEAADLAAAGTIVLPHMMQHHKLYVSAR